nr:hypothetical protein [Tanacetum cinerariifolium]
MGVLHKQSNDSLLARGNTLQSDKDIMKLNELMELCTNLQTRVIDLEKTKTTLAIDIDSLKKDESSDNEESLGKDASKQGRIEAIDEDEDITIVNVQDDTEIFDADKDLGGEEVFVEQEVVTDKEEINEVTLAQALVELETSKSKAKGVVIQEPKEHVKLKKKDQIRLDEEAALRLQAEFDEKERHARGNAQKEQEANIALIEEWDDIQAKVDVDYQLAKRLQAKEQKESLDAKKAKLFVQLLTKRRKHFAAKRAEEIKNKPPTKAQQRKVMTELVEGKEKRVGEELVQERPKKQKVEDLEDLYKLVKAKYGSTRPVEDLDLLLWGDLKTMFEPHIEDEVWKRQQGYKVLKYISPYTTYTYNAAGKEASKIVVKWYYVSGEVLCVKSDSSRLFSREDVENSKNMATRISTAPKNSNKESFIGKNPPRNITKLLDVAHGVTSIIVGTIIAIYKEEGWWYIGCRSCKKKVIRERDMIDLEADMPMKSASGKDDWWFRLQVRVYDETGTMSLSLWNDEVQAVVDRSAYQLCDKYANKVSIDEFNVKKLLPVFTVLHLSDDPEILDSIWVDVTPSKIDTKATSSALPNITPLDLESRTDENTTPIGTKINNAINHVDIEESSDGKQKRPAKNDVDNESLNGKKKAIKWVIRTKKYAELSAAKKIQADCDMKATNIILQGLPFDIYSLVNHHRVANDLWEIIQLLMQGDDPIACLNKSHSATIQGKQGQSYSSTGYKSSDTSSGGNNASKHARVVKRYNCQGEGHMARQCTQLKRPRNATWYKEKAMLAKAQKAIQILDEEQLAFLADLGVPNEVPPSETYLNDMENQNNALDFTGKHAQRIQELLVYVQDTCPNSIKPSAKKVAVTPKNKVKKVRFVEPLTSSSNIKQVESSTTSNSNTLVLSPTGLKCSTSNYGSKPLGNKKNDRISQTLSRNIKNKVESQPRNVNKKNHVVEPICNVDVKQSQLNANSELNSATCKKSMFDGVHDMCLLDFVEKVNSHVKSTKKHKNKIFGNLQVMYSLKITSANVVPPKTTTSHSVKSQKPELKVYSRKLKNVKNICSSKKAKIVESKNANHSEPNHTWGSNATDIPSSYSLMMTGCPDCSLVSGLWMFKTHDRESLSAHELSCALGKSKKSSHQPKAEDSTQEKLYLLHMDLCGRMRVASINEKKYILVIVDDYSRFTWVRFLSSKDEASEAIIKCIQNIHVRLNATDKKPDVSFFHVFGALSYPTNDNKDLIKLDTKADIGIFVGCAPVKKAFRIYNKTIWKFIETIHVTFDELTAMASEQFSSGSRLACMTPTTSSLGLVPNTISQQPCIPLNRDDWDHLFQPMFDEYYNPPTIAVSPVPVAAAPRAAELADSPLSTLIDQDAPSASIPSTQEQEQSLYIF